MHLSAIERDILATGPVVGKNFYAKTFPIVNIRDSDFDFLKNGMNAAVFSQKNKSYVRIFGRKK